jgi:hypothetical protein
VIDVAERIWEPNSDQVNPALQALPAYPGLRQAAQQDWTLRTDDEPARRTEPTVDTGFRRTCTDLGLCSAGKANVEARLQIGLLLPNSSDSSSLYCAEKGHTPGMIVREEQVSGPLASGRAGKAVIPP